MGKLLIVTLIMLCSIVITMPIVEAALAKDPKSVSNWFQKLRTKKEKLTTFRFYLHEISSGENATAFQVAQANITNSSPTFFGSVSVIDDMLKVGPEPDSKIVGRAQGITASVGLTETALHMTFNIVFTDGKYNGSTLSVLGRNPILDTYREMPIVGGSGVFRLAHGIVTTNTILLNRTSGKVIAEYNVIVLHY